MAKRKAKRKQVKKQRLILDKQFTCLFCNTERSIEIRIDRELNVGKLECRTCGVNWETHIHYLTEPIDIYSEWVDACENENNDNSNDYSEEVENSRSNPVKSKRSKKSEDDDEEDEDFTSEEEERDYNEAAEESEEEESEEESEESENEQLEVVKKKKLKRGNDL